MAVCSVRPGVGAGRRVSLRMRLDGVANPVGVAFNRVAGSKRQGPFRPALFQGWKPLRLDDCGLMMKTAPKRNGRYEDRQNGDQTHTHTSPLNNTRTHTH
jgi:hypothetical protein